MSFQGTSRMPHMVRCGWCLAVINTANLDVEMTIPTVDVDSANSAFSPVNAEIEQELMRPHARCPRCGHFLYVKEVKK